jgi:hypothetical protein
MISYEVSVRVTQLRSAADNLESAAQNIESAVNTTNGIVESLIARGFVSPAATAFHTRFLNQTTWMDDWPLQVREVAIRLNDAADALEEASRGESGIEDSSDQGDSSDETPGHSGEHGQGQDQQGGDNAPQNQGNDNSGEQGQGQDQQGGDNAPQNQGNDGGTPPPVPGGTSSPGGTSPQSTSSSDSESSSSSSTGGGGRSRGRSEHSNDNDFESEAEADEPEPPPEPAPLEAYMSGANRQLYDEIAASQDQIVAEQQNLELLTTRRQAVEEQLNDLTSRLEQAGASTENARVESLRAEIVAIDGDIANSQARMTDLETRISDIQTRLERVRPGPGADLDLIASLEGTRTIDAILNATRQSDNSINCVNWVVSQMPIPPGIPGNAMTWIDNAMARPEYGITVGNTPLAGSVIVMQPEHSFANDQFGHVMYVQRVENGLIWVTDNNNHAPVLLQDLTDELTGPNIQYMYFPWQTQG